VKDVSSVGDKNPNANLNQNHILCGVHGMKYIPTEQNRVIMMTPRCVVMTCETCLHHIDRNDISKRVAFCTKHNKLKFKGDFCNDEPKKPTPV
jgi:hypothetical protein